MISISVTILSVCAIYFNTAFGTEQEDLDYMSLYMNVQYDVLDNLVSSRDSRQRLTIINTGSQILRGGDWAIYYSNLRGVNRPSSGANRKYDYLSYGVNISHVQGCLFKIEPTSSFQIIQPNSSMEIFLLGNRFSISKSDFFPNWYVTARGLFARTIESTVGERLAYVGAFDSPNKWKRYSSPQRSDRYDPYTTQTRFDKFEVRNFGQPQQQVIPTPVRMNLFADRLVNMATKDWVIFLDDPLGFLRTTAQFVSDYFKMEIVNILPNRRFIIFKNIQPDVIANGHLSTSLQAYHLLVNDVGENVTISSASGTGAFYGFQTLKSLLTSNNRVPVVDVKDAPRYEFRGIHLDVGRNFHSKHAILRLIDALAMYKMNKFHFHLSDDEGWRIEIPGLPELTQFGSQRCHDNSETRCLVPQLGSGPTNQTSGSGFYTVDDYREILKYAKDRHIEVVPEFDMPGHSRAAVKSMERRYHKLMARGDRPGAERFLLSDLTDTSRYLSVQMFNDNTINLCLESAYTFVDHVVRALIDLHRDINPLKMFHFGGDEVPGAWVNSPKCRTFLAQNPDIRGAEDLKKHFAIRVSNITATYGLDLGAWWWGLMDKDSNVFNRSLMRNDRVVGYAGNNVWEWGGATRAYKLANAGYQVVLSHSSHLFFDHPYEPDPEERGFYWAGRFIDTRKTFGYMPDNFYDNVDVTVSGDRYTKVDLCGATGSRCVPLRRPENIQGLQALVWTETIRTEEEMNYMIFPRFLSLAERAWHKSDWESLRDTAERDRLRDHEWEDFANTLGHKELLRLDRLNIKYRIPPPGAKILNRLLVTNVEYPGLVVEHSLDGGNTWRTCCSQRVCGEILLRTRSASGSRTSRVVRLVNSC